MYLVGLYMYYKMIHGPYNVKVVYILTWGRDFVPITETSENVLKVEIRHERVRT